MDTPKCLADIMYDILFPSEKTGELPSVGGKIRCGDTELQHVCMADKFMSLDHCHRARLDGAIAFVCKDLLAGKRVTYFQSLYILITKVFGTNDLN